MSPEQKAAKISRADKFTIKLQNATNEQELEIIVQDILYALISRLDWADKKVFEGYFHEANYEVQFELHITALLSILDKYREYIKAFV